MKQRINKATARKVKLRSLKIPALKVRLRLHRGGIQPVALWGVESQGLAPRYRAALRNGMAKHLGHHTGGLLDVTYDIHAKRYIDPSDQVLKGHGCWAGLQIIPLQQHCGWAFTLDATPSTYDLRSQMWIFGRALTPWPWDSFKGWAQSLE